MTAVLAPAHNAPSLDKTTRLVARALQMSADELLAAFRPATMADLPQMLALRAAVLGTHITWDDQAYLSWRYGLGRPGQGGGECWVLVRQGELLGMLGTEDLPLQVGGTALAAVTLLDTLIRPELEGVGLGVWLNLAIRRHHACVVAVGSNPNSRGLVKRVFDPLPDRRTFTHPICFDHFMAKRVPVAVVAGLASRLVGAGMAALRLWRLGLFDRGHEVRMLAALPGDELSGLLAASTSPARVEVVRSRSHWAWRLRNPRTRFDIWGVWHQGRLGGLAITNAVAYEPGRQAWVVMDLVLPEQGQAAALRALLRAVLGEAARQRVDYLALTSYRQDIEPVLRHAGFLQQANPYETMAWFCQDEALRARVTACADWSFNEIHTDRDQ